MSVSEEDRICDYCGSKENIRSKFLTTGQKHNCLIGDDGELKNQAKTPEEHIANREEKIKGAKIKIQSITRQIGSENRSRNKLKELITRWEEQNTKARAKLDAQNNTKDISE